MTVIGDKVESIKNLIQLANHEFFEDTATDILWVKGLMKVERRILLLSAMDKFNNTRTPSKADIIDETKKLINLIYDSFGEDCTHYPIIEFIYFLSGLKHKYRQDICGDCIWLRFDENEEDCWEFCRGVIQHEVK